MPFYTDTFLSSSPYLNPTHFSKNSLKPSLSAAAIYWMVSLYQELGLWGSAGELCSLKSFGDSGSPHLVALSTPDAIKHSVGTRAKLGMRGRKNHELVGVTCHEDSLNWWKYRHMIPTNCKGHWKFRLAVWTEEKNGVQWTHNFSDTPHILKIVVFCWAS